MIQLLYMAGHLPLFESMREGERCQTLAGGSYITTSRLACFLARRHFCKVRTMGHLLFIGTLVVRCGSDSISPSTAFVAFWDFARISVSRLRGLALGYLRSILLRFQPESDRQASLYQGVIIVFMFFKNLRFWRLWPCEAVFRPQKSIFRAEK